MERRRARAVKVRMNVAVGRDVSGSMRDELLAWIERVAGIWP